MNYQHPEYPVGTVSTACFSQPQNNNSGYSFYYGGNGYVSDSAPRRVDGMNPFANNGFYNYNQPVQPQFQPQQPQQPDMSGSGVMGMLVTPEPGIQPNSVYGCGNNPSNGFNSFATDARRADAMNQQNVGYNPWAQNQAPVQPVQPMPQNYGYNYGYGYNNNVGPNEYPSFNGQYQFPNGNPFEKKTGANQWDALYNGNQFVFTGTGVMNGQWPTPNQQNMTVPNYTFPQNAMPNLSQPTTTTFAGPELSWTAQANASWATK